ncbi:hypothetical protein MNBD_ALPHA05-1955, partial [hydrothermal vent metagenome]
MSGNHTYLTAFGRSPAIFQAMLIVVASSFSSLAQETKSVLSPSFAEVIHRLEATEAELQNLRERGSKPCGVCQESPSSNKSSWKIVPFGYLSGEAIGTTSATISRPLILYVAEDLGASDQIFSVTGQTTALGLDFSGPKMGTFQSGGMILFNFLGDRPALNQATPFFLRGYGELKNENWRFTFGQQGDLFNPIDPVTVNFGGHKQAGNGGAFRGSLRVERYLRPTETVQWTLQAALS